MYLGGEMRMNPHLRINLASIKTNTETVVGWCHERGIQVAGVTKLFCGNPDIASAYVAGGVDLLADSRISNLKKLSHFELPKMLLRTPMISQANEIIKWSDMALVSEPETALALSDAACVQQKDYRIILMVDLGDLREGIYHESEIFNAVSRMIKMPQLQLAGLGTNLTCYGGVKPSAENLTKLVSLKKSLERMFSISLDVLSGGNGSTLSLFSSNEVPGEINQLRVGSSLAMGIGLNDDPIQGLRQDAFLLRAEITEIREKPSVPIGETGLDAFGEKPVFTERGMRLRAICAIGRQDVHPDHLRPVDVGIRILGASSDHLILDVTDATRPMAVGDVLAFYPSYGGVLSAMTSGYVDKIIV
jgi:ornithine racemase